MIFVFGVLTFQLSVRGRRVLVDMREYAFCICIVFAHATVQGMLDL